METVVSNPNFDLSVCSDAPLSAVGELLGLNFSKTEPTAVCGLIKVSDQIGWIRVYFRETDFFPTGPYKENWRFQISFETSSRWNEIREVLVFKLFDWLQEKFPGVYLGALDTGKVIFHVKDGKLKIN
jgi:hypothetical protein